MDRHKPGYYAEYYQKNKQRIQERQTQYVRQKRQTDVLTRLANRLRNRLYLAVKNNQKSGSAVADLGCSIPELKQHLESQFQPGMTWENYGQWHIQPHSTTCKFQFGQ